MRAWWADWASDKRALFDAALPDTAMPGPAAHLGGAALASPYSPATFRAPVAPGKLPLICSSSPS